MQNTPLVTVVCLCYNHGQFVVETLNSVINQTYPNIELIIVDDCSTDNSVNIIREWLKEHPSIPFIANEKNLGNTTAFNKAFKICNGDYIIDLAADDILMEYCVAMQINQFQNSAYENVGIVYGGLELIDENNHLIGNFFEIYNTNTSGKDNRSGDIYKGLLNMQNNVCSVSSMVKREVYDRFSGYDESLAYEDYDLWIKTARYYNFDFIDTTLVRKRELKTSMTSYRSRRWNKKTWKLGFSTYKILLKALHLNRTKEENRAMLKRIRLETKIAIRTGNVLLALRFVWLEMRIRILLLR
ncbi:glycosyltransferase involved in cell wall biosynthesis [Flavobacterium arsenatis]|uniref:Glycosyltransferase involved in cell wall biosynthesis n=1 Tax=Flavobacterium arsenatis TaxID=1484332 RepID=A0ABU1TP08_9FLAO|nr:glycosyltransferase [Flavobacterium arsenatis]MDR6967671.1 glycosyltransferase involved in cell wall biosynthesis [Flavobacterium arsenatis]